MPTEKFEEKIELAKVAIVYYAGHGVTFDNENYLLPTDINPKGVRDLDLHALTFLFGIAAVVGLYSLHRLTLVEEAAGTTDRLLLRHLLLEARRSVHSLSSAAGLLRVVKAPSWRVRPASGAPPAADFS